MLKEWDRKVNINIFLDEREEDSEAGSKGVRLSLPLVFTVVEDLLTLAIDGEYDVMGVVVFELSLSFALLTEAMTDKATGSPKTNGGREQNNKGES